MFDKLTKQEEKFYEGKALEEHSRKSEAKKEEPFGDTYYYERNPNPVRVTVVEKNDFVITEIVPFIGY